MKKIFLLTTTFTLTLILVTTKAQNCKPDYSKLDKIEKKQIDAWTAELYETSLGASLLKTSEVTITVSIGREDTSNFIQIQLKKREESDLNAAFESSLKGAKGDEFYFGIKNGEPLKFIATDVINQTKRESVSGKLATTVVLSSSIPDEDLTALKNAVIDATRIKLENDVIVEQPVKEKQGNKMMQKVVCFFNFLQEKGYMK